MQRTGAVQARFDSFISFLDYTSTFSSEGDEFRQLVGFSASHSIFYLTYVGSAVLVSEVRSTC